jgi:hypothetical protein
MKTVEEIRQRLEKIEKDKDDYVKGDAYLVDTYGLPPWLQDNITEYAALKWVLDEPGQLEIRIRGKKYGKHGREGG